MLSEIYHKKVKVKNKDGSYSYERRPFVRLKESKPKKARVPKWVSKLVASPKKTKSKLRVSPTDWQLMELQKERRDLNAACGTKRKSLEAKYNAFYAKYPHKKPKSNAPRKSGKGTVPCSSGRFATCEAVVYTYPTGNRRIVTTERLPATKKKTKRAKGVADGCDCCVF